jgi:hypothetical protein
MTHVEQQAENAWVVMYSCGGLVFVDEAYKAICGGRECAGCNIHGPLFKRKCVHYIVLKKKWPLVPSKEEESHCLKGLTHKKDALLLIITPLQLFLVAKTLCHPK